MNLRMKSFTPTTSHCSRDDVSDLLHRPDEVSVGEVGVACRGGMAPVPACTNIIENMNGTIRRVCRNVKRCRDAKRVLRWASAAMLEAAKGVLRLKAHKQLPTLRAALLAHQATHCINPDLAQQDKAA